MSEDGVSACAEEGVKAATRPCYAQEQPNVNRQTNVALMRILTAIKWLFMCAKTGHILINVAWKRLHNIDKQQRLKRPPDLQATGWDSDRNGSYHKLSSSLSKENFAYIMICFMNKKAINLNGFVYNWKNKAVFSDFFIQILLKVWWFQQGSFFYWGQSNIPEQTIWLTSVVFCCV